MNPTLPADELLDAVNAVLAETSRLNSPASEIRAVRRLNAETVEVECFGMNDEPLTFHLATNEDGEEETVTLVSGTIS